MNGKTLFAAGKMLVETYLEASPELDAIVQDHLERIVATRSPDPVESIDAYEVLHNELGKGKSRSAGAINKKGGPHRNRPSLTGGADGT